MAKALARILRRHTKAAAWLTVAVALAAGIVTTPRPTPAQSQSGGVAFLLPATNAYRWENQDHPDFVAAMKKYGPDIPVQVANALESAARQQAQAEAAITNGVKALVLSPVDAKAAAKIVKDARAQGVTVIGYTRALPDAPINYYVGGNVVALGETLAQYWAQHVKPGDNLVIIKGDPGDDNVPLYYRGIMNVLKPMVDAGKIHIVGDVFTPHWDAAAAQREMEQILSRTNNNVQGVISLNDGMAVGVLAALRAQGLEGKVPVSGGDASIPALQEILKDNMVMSVYFSIGDMADHAAHLASYIAKGQKPPADFFNSTFNNGLVTVPFYYVKNEAISKDNIEDVIKDGAATQAQVCTGIPHGTGPC
jgi:D-xylose transport system substrate-binding protein